MAGFVLIWIFLTKIRDIRCVCMQSFMCKDISSFDDLKILSEVCIYNIKQRMNELDLESI